MNAIQQLEKALKNNNTLYNKVGLEEITFKEAGKIYDRQVGYETIQALKLALEKLREEN